MKDDHDNISEVMSLWENPIKLKFVVIMIVFLLILSILSTVIFMDIFEKEEELPVVKIDDYNVVIVDEFGQPYYYVGFFFINDGGGLVRNLVVTYTIDGYSNNGLEYKKVITDILEWDLDTRTVLSAGTSLNITDGIDYYLINVHCSWMHGSAEWNFFMDNEPTLRLEGEMRLS